METRNYELMLVVSAELDEDALDLVLQRVQRYLESVEAQVVSFKSWGLRRLAYTVKGEREGRYYLVHFSAGSQVIPELDGDLRLVEGVLRHLITRMEAPMPVASDDTPPSEETAVSEDATGPEDAPSGEDVPEATPEEAA